MQQLGGGGARLGVLVYGVGDGGEQVRRHAGQVGSFVNDPEQQRLGGPHTERAPARCREGNGDSPREDVSRGGDGWCAGELLGRGIAEAAQYDTGAAYDGLRRRGGNTEIDHLEAVGAEHDVPWFEVFVYDARRVDGVQRRSQIRGDGVDPFGWQRPAGGGGLPEVRPRHVFGGEPGQVGVGVGVEKPCGPAAPDGPHSLDLVPEPRSEVRVGRVILPHHLDRSGPAGAVGREVDHSHATYAEAGGQPVRPDCGRVVGTQRRQRHADSLRSASADPFRIPNLTTGNTAASSNGRRTGGCTPGHPDESPLMAFNRNTPTGTELGAVGIGDDGSTRS